MEKLISKIKCVFVSFLLVFLFVSDVRALEIVVTENGSGSQNIVETQVQTKTTVEQSNEVEVVNDIDVNANTGENTASGNTSEEVTIQTGDVSNDVVIENTLNESVIDTGCCSNEQVALIEGNGTGSSNEIVLGVGSETIVVSNQTTSITNNISGIGNTGSNDASDNSGSVSITTGDIRVSGKVENSANVSSIGAASPNPDIYAVILDNGSGSDNNITAVFSFDTLVFTDYDSVITNNILWDLNTGGNVANGNVGDVSIGTGDIWFDFIIDNGPINVGGVVIDCCTFINPYDPQDPGDPGGPGDPEDPGVGGDGDSGGSDSGGNGGDAQGTLLASAASTILGLSDTSSGESNSTLLLGFLFLMVGVMLLSGELKKYNALQLNEAG